MPRLYNKRVGDVPSSAVYIGRPGPWGNPFSIGQDGDRATVIQKYREWLAARPALQAQMRKELAGRDLVCWCHPHPCHGDIILEFLETGVLSKEPAAAGSAGGPQLGLF